MPYLIVNFLLVLVSSHSMREDKDKIDNDVVIEETDQMGVETTYSPGRKLFLFN